MDALKKPKILVVGSFMMDLIASAKRLPSMGETVIGTTFRTAPGGKGANQAVQCARLGAEVTMVGCVGDDAFGREMLQTARDAGVDVSRVSISSHSASGVGSIQLEVHDDGVENRILVVPGANYDLSPEDLVWLADEIGHYDMVLLQLEIRMDTTRYVAALADAAGVPVMLNPAPACALDRELLSHVTYLSPNEHEAALLADRPLRVSQVGVDSSDLDEVANTLLASGVKKLIVTLGENGCALFGAEGQQRFPCVTFSEVKDPTAAGDSFVAAFCTAKAAGLPEPEALQFASHTAAITVCSVGAMPSLPMLDAVQRFMHEQKFAGFDLSLLEALKAGNGGRVSC